MITIFCTYSHLAGCIKCVWCVTAQLVCLWLPTWPLTAKPAWTRNTYKRSKSGCSPNVCCSLEHLVTCSPYCVDTCCPSCWRKIHARLLSSVSKSCTWKSLVPWRTGPLWREFLTTHNLEFVSKLMCWCVCVRVFAELFVNSRLYRSCRWQGIMSQVQVKYA